MAPAYEGTVESRFRRSSRWVGVLWAATAACSWAPFEGDDDDVSGDGGADADADTDADTDADVDSDADVDGDVDSDGDGDTDADSDADVDGDADGDGGTVGQPCASRQDCRGPAADCIPGDLGWPNGYCTQACEGGTCPGDAVCDVDDTCYDGCAGDAECRAGYVCGGYGLPGICGPRCYQNVYCGNGGYCADDGHCAASRGGSDLWSACTRDECDGFCLDDADVEGLDLTGFAATCTWSCAEGPCPDGSDCVPVSDLLWICLPWCEVDEDCARNGADRCVEFEGGGGPVCFWL